MQWANVLYFLVWAALIFFMMRFGCGAHVLGHGHGRGSHAPDRERGSTAPPAKTIDPVCGRTVDTVTAKSAVHRGRPFYFCSNECWAKFEAAPATYAAPSSGPPAHEVRHHGC